MKKTLFAMAALAMVMPAMAGNYAVNSAQFKPVPNITLDAADYKFYLWLDQSTDVSAVISTIGNMTYEDFLSHEAQQGYGSYSLTKAGGATNPNLKTIGSATAPLIDTLTVGDPATLFGVCVFQGSEESAAAFTVVDPTLKTTTLGGLDGAVQYNSTSTTYNFFKTSVPEPATATLSLLALAGLAARRRRH